MPNVGPVWNVDWLNANSQRAYPLSETVSRKDITGSFELPNDFLVDLLLPVHADASIDPSLFHVKSVGIFGTGVSLTFGYDGTAIGSVSVDAASFALNTQLIFQGTGDFFDTIGKVIIGSLDTILNFAGSFEFDVAGARIEPHAIVPDLRGVNAVFLRNGDDVIGPITGDLVLQAGRNFLMNFVPGPGSEPDRVVLNAISGEGLNEDCDCGEAADRPCIETINGIAPDDTGDLSVIGDDCLELDAIAGGLRITEACASPCCGCPELEVVNEAMQFVVNQVYTMEAKASQLEQALLTLENVILPSKTGTQS